MLNDYVNFLKNKEDTWRKAKQQEYNSIEQIMLALENLDQLTTRNSMTLRILGLVDNLGNDQLTLTPAGNTLLTSNDKQNVIDEQLFKIYLDSSINRRLKMPVYPIAIIFKIFSKISYITFIEYQLVVCWINDHSETDTAIDLIQLFRNLNEFEKNQIIDIHKQKVSDMNIKRFDDHVYRLFNMYTLSSFIDYEGVRYKKVLLRNSSETIYKELHAILRSETFSYSYSDILNKYHGIISIKPDFSTITKKLHSLGKNDRQIIEQEIRESIELPAVEEVRPIQINPNITSTRSIKTKQRKRKSSTKIDYETRDSKNRLVGLHAEKIVYAFEYNSLIKAGNIDLANKINHVSLEDDSLGYDIKSFGPDEVEKHIEVKAVKGRPKTFSFFISANELHTAKIDKLFQIYIVFEYDSVQPKIWKFPNVFIKNTQGINITPVNYKVSLSVDKIS